MNANSMSDTPRTDRAQARADADWHTHDPYYAMRDFARELERENAQLRDALTEIMAYTDPCEDRAHVIAEAALANNSAQRTTGSNGEPK